MRSGIYKIRCVLNNKSYIGSAIRLTKRKSEHWHGLLACRHANVKLQRAWNKHGADAFVFEVLLYCDPADCLLYEQIALDHYKPEYNICLNARNRLGVKARSSTRKKLSKLHKGKTVKQETRLKISKSMQGYKPSQSTLDAHVKGANHPMSKLSDDDVKAIRFMFSDGGRLKDVANKYHISIAQASRIKNNKRWKSLD